MEFGRPDWKEDCGLNTRLITWIPKNKNGSLTEVGTLIFNKICPISCATEVQNKRCQGEFIRQCSLTGINFFLCPPWRRDPNYFFSGPSIPPWGPLYKNERSLEEWPFNFGSSPSCDLFLGATRPPKPHHPKYDVVIHNILERCPGLPHNTSTSLLMWISTLSKNDNAGAVVFHIISCGYPHNFCQHYYVANHN